jgi:hypothetical protein
MIMKKNSKKSFKKYLLRIFVSWFSLSAYFSASFVFAEEPSCDNFNAASYTFANNAGNSRFLINTPIETNLVLKVKDAVSLGENVDIILVMDRSGSMKSKEAPTALQTKIQAAKSALNMLIDVVAETGNLNNRVALVTFSSDVTLDQPLTNDYNTLKVAINNIIAGGSTNIGGGLFGAASELKTNSINPATRRFIVLASDGLQNPSPGIPSIPQGIIAVPSDTTVYTVGIGADADPIALKRISSTAGVANGLSFSSNVADLSEIFKKIILQILGAFTLRDVSLSFMRDDVSHARLIGTVPANDLYDSVNGIIQWNNLGDIVNGQHKNLSINYQGVRTEKNIPINTPSLLLKYAIFDTTCSEDVPVNVLSVDIVDNTPPPPSCRDIVWTPDSSTVCSTQMFTQTSNCGTNRRTNGTKLCTECADSIDNDDDDFIDYPTDPGCSSLLDDNEKNYYFQFLQF